MEEIEKLKTEIKILNKRLSILESRENRRRMFSKIKLIFNVVFVLAVIFGGWYLYDYVTNYIPNQIKDNVTNLIPEIFK